MKIILPLASAAVLLFASAAVSAVEVPEAMKKAGCLACHAVDKKLVGPSYKDVAAKYKGDKKAAEALAATIKAGGSGKWGPVPMPANNVTDDEAKKLAHWVLSL